MDLSNQNIMSNYNYSFDRKHLLNLLKEKDLAIESLRREVIYQFNYIIIPISINYYRMKI